MNRYKPRKQRQERVRKMVNIVIKFEEEEEEEMPDRDAKGWKVEGRKRRVTMRSKRLVEVALGGFMRRKVSGTLPKKEC